jgi:hypothetical protein
LIEAVNNVRQQNHSINSKHDIYKIKSISEAGLELEAIAKAERTRIKAMQEAKKKELLELKNKQQTDFKLKEAKEAAKTRTEESKNDRGVRVAAPRSPRSE